MGRKGESLIEFSYHSKPREGCADTEAGGRKRREEFILETFSVPPAVVVLWPTDFGQFGVGMVSRGGFFSSSL